MQSVDDGTAERRDRAEGAALYHHRGTRAVQRMVEYAPCTGGLALWVHHRDRAAGEDTGSDTALASTDGGTIFYRAAFEQLPVALQAGWVAHEVLHIALRHPQRLRDLQHLLGDVDASLFNTCADAIVNSTLAHLAWLELPREAVQLDRLLALTLGVNQPVEKSLLEWDVERLYRSIDDRRPGRSTARRNGGRSQQADGDGKSQEADAGAATQASSTDAAAPVQRIDGPRAACVRSLGAGMAPDLSMGTDAAAPMAPEDEAELAREWSERLLRAHAGDGAHSMLRALIADLPRSRTPWPQVLRTRLAHALARRPDLSWSRPSRSYIANQGRAGPHRRMPWEPGTSHAKPVARLALMVDVSGSIDDALLERFAREVEAITRRYEAALVLVIGDCVVRRVEHCEPGHCDLRAITFAGGGGTDFSPLLEEADRHRPDIGVVLTDLEGPAAFRPRWPVVWAVPPAHATAQAPFGRTLVLE
jgi:predicted metal-dependent peptidase